MELWHGHNPCCYITALYLHSVDGTIFLHQRGSLFGKYINIITLAFQGTVAAFPMLTGTHVPVAALLTENQKQILQAILVNTKKILSHFSLNIFPSMEFRTTVLPWLCHYLHITGASWSSIGQQSNISLTYKIMNTHKPILHHINNNLHLQ